MAVLQQGWPIVWVTGEAERPVCSGTPAGLEDRSTSTTIYATFHAWQQPCHGHSRLLEPDILGCTQPGLASFL